MKNMKKINLISLAVLVLALAAIAWASVKITGGGLLIDSSTGQSVATLTLQCHNCNDANNSASGKFNLVDHQTGAHLKGDLKAYVKCAASSNQPGGSVTDDCKLFCNPAFSPGTHLLYGKADSGMPLAICIQDNGQGNKDTAVVVIPPSGSSANFRRFKINVNGNFVVHQ
ncbi:MAG: hypothetical protein ACREEM_45660 [Blastocatellia bacterium]